MADDRLIDFIRESNRIEGIVRAPTQAELDAHATLLAAKRMTIDVLSAFQRSVAPGMPIRDHEGFNVRVGGYIAPRGGDELIKRYKKLCEDVNRIGTDEGAWRCHCRFELLHPYMDGNGRTGRALWAWAMRAVGRDPFSLPFLHRFYYQTLAAQR